MLLHLSDLHFGTEQVDRVKALQQFCSDHPPELIVVSGDLTQRARYQQFFKCREFLENLGRPYLVVPGNHDIPLYHVWRRFMSPFGRFQLFFGSPEQELRTAHFFVIGVNSIRPKYHTKGSISMRQIHHVSERLAQIPENILKFVAVHQPFYTEPEDKHRKDCPVMGGIALTHWSKQGLNGLLHGHLHQSAVYHLNPFYHLNAHQPVLDIHAGTALSDRLHHQDKNGFNCIYTNGAIEAFIFDEGEKCFKIKQELWSKN